MSDSLQDEDGELPEGVHVDVSSLNRRQREATTLAARTEVERAFAEQMRACTAELETLAPNLRATEHMTEVQQRMEELNKEFEQARERAAVATKVKRSRVVDQQSEKNGADAWMYKKAKA